MSKMVNLAPGHRFLTIRWKGAPYSNMVFTLVVYSIILYWYSVWLYSVLFCQYWLFPAPPLATLAYMGARCKGAVFKRTKRRPPVWYMLSNTSLVGSTARSAGWGA